MTLAEHLKAQIAEDGPMTLAAYMTQCLLHPTLGYYTSRDPLGREGDFTTAPEISQMFGELIGLALAQAWMDQGRPADPILVELGPGRGTLMSDVLRAIGQVPGFDPAVHFVEASPTLRAEQAKRVPTAVFHDDISTLPPAPLFLIANEFFDALPIRQFQRSGASWRERVVGAELTLGLANPAPVAFLDDRLADTSDGDIVEVCPALPSLVAQLDALIDTHGGAALIIDYGDWISVGDTFQALRSHAREDPFASPGEADLTAHVDFAAIAQAVTACQHSLLTSQGVFLERLGITQRAQNLARSLSGEALTSHIAAHRRLTHPSEMGDLFKVMGITPQAQPMLPGLET